MDTPTDNVFPPLPELGEEDTYYGKIAHKAEKSGDLITRSVFKVAQYITLGKSTGISWEEKLKYFRHAIERHAKARPPIDEHVWAYFEQLKDWVRRECGAEAMKIVMAEDAILADRKTQNEARFRLVSDAAQFFRQFIPAGEKPDWFTDEDFQKLRAIQLKWA